MLMIWATAGPGRKVSLPLLSKESVCSTSYCGPLLPFSELDNHVVTQTSILVSGEAAEQAAKYARARGLPVGLHINLTEG